MVSLPVLCDITFVIMNEAIGYIPIRTVGGFLPSRRVNRFQY